MFNPIQVKEKFNLLTAPEKLTFLIAILECLTINQCLYAIKRLTDLIYERMEKEGMNVKA